MKDSIFTAFISEFFATFFLVLVGGSAVALGLGGSVIGTAFAFGLIAMMIIFVMGKYSGAHANPAVSLGFALTGRMDWGRMLGYWVAQILGGIAAGALVSYIFSGDSAGQSVGTLTDTDQWKAFMIEAFVALFIVLGYLFVYRSPDLASVNGLAIGLILTFCFLAFGPLTGASGNPARSFGPAIFSNNLSSSWIYWVAPLVGALVAAGVYWMFTWDYDTRAKMTEGDCPKPVKDNCGNCLRERKVPIVDNCGNPILDDCKKPQYEWITYTPEKYSYKQTTWIKKGGEWLKNHGMSPLWMAEKMNSYKSRVGSSPITSELAKALNK